MNKSQLIDYEEFVLNVHTNLQPGGCYQHFLDECCNMIQEFFQNGKFIRFDPIYTYSFINDFIPDVVSIVTHFNKLDSKEVELVIRFLQISSFLIPYAYSHSGLEKLLMIFDQNLSFYTKNKKKGQVTNSKGRGKGKKKVVSNISSSFDPWKKVYNEYIQKEGPALFVFMLYQEINEIVEKHLLGNSETINSFLFKLVKFFEIISAIRNNLLAKEISSLMNNALQILETLFSEYDPKDSNVSVQNLMPIIQFPFTDLDRENCRSCFSFVSKYLMYCLNSGNLNMQLKGADFLLQIYNLKNSQFEFLIDSFRDLNFLKTFFSQDLHHDLITRLIPCSFFFIFNEESMNIVLNKAVSSIPLERIPLFKFACNSISVLKNPFDFLVSLSENQVFHPFLFEAALSINDPQLIVLIATLNLSITELKTASQAFLEKLTIEVKKQMLKTDDDEYRIKRAVLLKNIFSVCPKMIQQCSVDEIMPLTNKGPDLLDLATTVLLSNGRQLSDNHVTQILGFEDKGIIILTDILEKNGARAFDLQGFAKIESTLNKYDFHKSTPTLIQFISDLIKAKISIGKNNNKTKITVNSLPFPCESFLYSALLLSSNESTVKCVKDTLINFYRTIPLDHIDSIHEEFINRYKMASDDEEKLRIIDLIYQFIIKVEDLKDPQILRHNIRIELNKDEIIINVLFQNREYPIKVKLNETIYNLMMKAGAITGRGLNKMILQFHKKTLDKSLFIGSCGLSNNDTVEMLNAQPSSKIFGLSNLLSKSKFTSDLLNCLELDCKQELRENAWKLLMILPTDPNISEMLTPEFIDKFIQNLMEKSMPPLVFKYYLMAYLNQKSKIITETFGQKGIFAINKGFQDPAIFESTAYEIVLTLDSIWHPGIAKNPQKLIIPLINSIKICPKAGEKACKLILNICLPENLIQNANSTNAKKETSAKEETNEEEEIITENQPTISPKEICKEMQSNKVLELLKEVINNCHLSSKGFSDLHQALRYSLTAKEFDFLQSCKPPYNLEFISDLVILGNQEAIYISTKLLSETITTMNQEISNQQIDQDQILLLCQSISNLLHTSQIDKAPYVKELFNIAENVPPEAQKTIFKLIAESKSDPSQLHKQILTFNTTRWGIPAIQEDKSSLGFSGLRNMGATCYMNSILQQLYCIPIFQNQIFTSVFDDPQKIQLQQLFLHLLLTRRPTVDTEPLTKVWKGWDGNPINPHQQQDAFEFVQFLLDQLPDSITSIFKGSFQSIIKRASDDEILSKNIESFTGINLPIRGVSNLEEAFLTFAEEEYFTGQNAYQYEGQKIDAKKKVTIQNAPDVLILQLKRFEFNLSTYMRYKINDRFEFPFNITNNAYLRKDYTLNGVVLHRGDAQGGHYTSLIRIKNEWIQFNDNEISILPDDEFESSTFGFNDLSDDYDWRGSAYLLFYISNDLLNNPSYNPLFLNFNDFKKPNFSQIMETNKISNSLPIIQKDNKDFLDEKCYFGEPMFDFMINTATPKDLFQFFINIFCHSRSISYADQFVDKILCTDQFIPIINILSESSNQLNILEFYINCSKKEIIESMTKILLSLSDVSLQLYEVNQKPFFIISSLFTFIINNLNSFAHSYRQLPFIGKLSIDYLTSNPKNAEQSILNKWGSSLLRSLKNIFKTLTSKTALSDINTSDLFLSVIHVIQRGEPEMQGILEIAPSVMLSKNKDQGQSYLKLLSKMAGLHFLDIDQLFAILSSYSTDFTDSKKLSFLMQVLSGSESESELNSSLNLLCDFPLWQVVDEISKQLRVDAHLRSLVLRFPDSLFFNFIQNDDNIVQSNAKSILHNLSPSPSESSFLVSKYIPLIPKISSHSMITFLETLRYLMEKTQFDTPLSEKVFDAVFLISSDSFDVKKEISLILIHCHLKNSDKLLKALASIFNSEIPEGKLSSFRTIMIPTGISVLNELNLNDKLSFLALPNWNKRLKENLDRIPVHDILPSIMPLLPKEPAFSLAMQILSQSGIEETHEFLSQFIGNLDNKGIQNLVRQINELLGQPSRGKKIVEKQAQMINDILNALRKVHCSVDVKCALSYVKKFGHINEITKNSMRCLALILDRAGKESEEYRSEIEKGLRITNVKGSDSHEWNIAVFRILMQLLDRKSVQELSQTFSDAIGAHAKSNNNIPGILFNFYNSLSQNEYIQFFQENQVDLGTVNEMLDHVFVKVMIMEQLNFDDRDFIKTFRKERIPKINNQILSEIIVELTEKLNSITSMGYSLSQRQSKIIKKLYYIIKRRPEMKKVFEEKISPNTLEALEGWKKEIKDKRMKYLNMLI